MGKGSLGGYIIGSQMVGYILRQTDRDSRLYDGTLSWFLSFIC